MPTVRGNIWGSAGSRCQSFDEGLRGDLVRTASRPIPWSAHALASEWPVQRALSVVTEMRFKPNVAMACADAVRWPESIML